MKKVVIVVVLVVLAIAALTSVWKIEQNSFQRKIGGTITIDVPEGMKVMSATIDPGGSVFYLTEPFDSGYTPKTKVLREESNLGFIELTVKFKEHGRKRR